MKRRSVCAVALVGIVIAGLVWREAPLGLPRFAWKYGGSALWAGAVYWALAVVWVRARVVVLTVAAAAIAVAVEFSRLWRVDWLDAFRETLAGQLLLGKYFSLRNVVAYFAGIAVCAVVDGVWVRQAR